MIKRFWNRFRFYSEVLSVDICGGVIGSGAIAHTVMQARTRSAWWWILPLSVWVIYTADHLFDGFKLGRHSVNPRHRFHYDHFCILTITAVLCGILSMVAAIYFLRDLVVIGGSLVGLLALLHLILAFWGRIRFGKEISVAVVYTCGVWLAPVLNRSVIIGAPELSALLFFFLAAVQNVLMNAIVEYQFDRVEGEAYAAGIFPHLWLRITVYAIAIMAVLWGLISINAWHRIDQSIACAIIVVLNVLPAYLMAMSHKRFVRSNYRVMAEWAFAAGLLVLLF